MYPNIILGNVCISSWYASLSIGSIISIVLAVYLRPLNFPLKRREILILSIGIIAASLFGARLLFILLNRGAHGLNAAEIFSTKGGFAYFGALFFSILFLWVYAVLKKTPFSTLLDYSMPFLMLSQAFVRIGCLLAGCCYGKMTNGFFGIVFKVAGGGARHPTQGYEALLLVVIYVFARLVYERSSSRGGVTSLYALILYGVGRFCIEYLRVDSPMMFLGLTLAQITCLSLALVSTSILFAKTRDKA